MAMEKTCGTCWYWFWWGDDKPPKGHPFKMCNHPHITGNGQIPHFLKATDGCQKWRLDRQRKNDDRTPGATDDALT